MFTVISPAGGLYVAVHGRWKMPSVEGLENVSVVHRVRRRTTAVSTRSGPRVQPKLIERWLSDATCHSGPDTVEGSFLDSEFHTGRYRIFAARTVPRLILKTIGDTFVEEAK